MSGDRRQKPAILKFVPAAGKEYSDLGASDIVDNDEDDGCVDLRDKVFNVIVDRFDSLGEITATLKKVGMTECGLIFGIDYTMSNKVQGANSFKGRSLHDVSGSANPYQEVICILGETLEPLDSDGMIPAFGFGDKKARGDGIFPLKEDGTMCEGFLEVLEVYNEVTPNIKMAGPTNFAPLINEAVEIVKKEKQFHILVIVADGQVTNEDETVEAIVNASEYPLSIVVIGVGDGPWEVMDEFDDNLPERKFDNFQFVQFHKVKAEARNPQAAVALAALMEIPDQYLYIRKNNLLENL